MAVPMAVTVPMAMAVVHVGNGFGGRGRVQEKVGVQRHEAAPAHEKSSGEQHARHTQGAQTLNLSKPRGKCVGRRLETP